MMNNYIDFINEFWEKRRLVGLNSSDADVFFALLNEANRQFWEQPFILSTNIICAELQMSRPTFLRARNKLQQLGFIKFEAGQRNVEKAKYFMLKNVTRTETRTFTRPVTRTETRTFTNNKDKDKNKDILPPIIPPQGEDDVAKPKAKPQRAEWKDDFNLYRSILKAEVDKLLADGEWMAKMQSYYPNVDILKSIDKCCETFWATEAGWQNKKRKQSNTIDWKRTITNALAQNMNKVYLQKNNHYERANDKYQESRRNCFEAILETFGGNIQ